MNEQIRELQEITGRLNNQMQDMEKKIEEDKVELNKKLDGLKEIIEVISTKLCKEAEKKIFSVKNPSIGYEVKISTFTAAMAIEFAQEALREEKPELVDTNPAAIENIDFWTVEEIKEEK